jgi:hypothetical protein
MALSLFLGIASSAQACSGCGCSLDTDETLLNRNKNAGFRIDERVDYTDQSRLWQGTRSAPPQDPANGEVQKKTLTVFYTTTIDYTSENDWGVNLAIPFQYRDHTTYNQGTFDPSSSRWNTVSDVRLLGRYNGLTESKNYGVLFGMKLPTGSHKKTFDSGTEGQVVDPGLQPGTGTWDLLLGLTQGGQITESLSWFAQELWQKPLNQHADFRPGQTLSSGIGVSYALNEVFVPQFGFNLQNRGRETGAAADRANSGGATLSAVPGLFVNVREDTAIYGFVQIPVYQRVGGVQLVPDYSASVGVRFGF